MTELPPLPEPDSILIGPDGDFNAYTADQMREHAAEAVRVALEQAAQICTPMHPNWCECSRCMDGPALAAAIRALKGTP